MFTKLLILSALFVSAFCLSIGTVSERNVTKRETNAGDLFPDWVPFKNKHGDELGEFVQVEKKSKVKKRLAPPINFLLRAVAEPETPDDYFDKAGGESDSDDNYDNKDWSDLHRPAEAADKQPVKINHTDISDIDGVVDIIIKSPPNPIIEAILDASNKELKENSARATNDKESKDKEVNNEENADEKSKGKETKEKQIEQPVYMQKELSTTVNAAIEAPLATAATEPQTISEEKKDDKKDINNEEENEDYEEEPSKSNKSEENKESEARKAKILSGVDELKERHAEEQRELAEKIKGEDMFKDEFGKEKDSDETPDRFSGKFSEETTEQPQHRHRKQRRRKPTPKPDYDEYEDTNKSVEDKYKINVYKSETEPPNTERPRNKKTTAISPRNDVHKESGKVSVFKNPHLFMMYDDDDTAESKISERKQAKNKSTRGPKKFSSKYTTVSPYNSDERISLVPVDSKEGEPTLFFPKPRKNKRKKVRSTTPASDSSVAETVTETNKQTTAYGVTAPDSTGNSTETTASGAGTEIGAESTDTDTTGTDSVPARTAPVVDAVPAPSDHKKEHQPENYHREKGSDREHHSEHSEEHEEHGKKAYEGHHEDSKTAKGHHDKENHLGKYDDHGGVEKHHSDEAEHYGDHHHEEHGKKHAKYEESGKHSKGHSTKGSHDIHKKEEYEKKVEFFEEEGDSAEDEKHGGYNEEKEHKQGGKFGKGNYQSGHEQHHKGESGHFAKGGHQHAAKGHKQSGGHDGHGKKGQRHFQKEGKDSGRKWIFHHGHPAKTANLVVIDRRGFDQFYHGPHYYG